MKFTEFNLKTTTLNAIDDLGYTDATEIQDKSIPLLLEDDIDFIGQAQTGTGKTAAFAVPLIEKIDTKLKGIQSIILAPTRELANQIAGEIEKLSKYDPIKSFCVYGGVPISTQIRSLQKTRPQILVGTPGRVLDLLRRGVLKLDTAKYFVLDEADEMLDMGFFEDVNEILDTLTSEDRKIWMFSATMPKDILKLIKKHFSNPKEVRVTKRILTADSVEQKFIVMQERDMTEALSRYIDFQEDMYAIVFVKTKIGAKRISDDLNTRGFDADALHGDMVQDQRDITMNKFKKKRVKLLVCTDVAARGIDVNDLTHVINICLPQDNESYVHRIGRTGRGGNKGTALSFIPTSELRRLRDIERITKAKIEEEKLPTVVQIKDTLRKKSFEKFMGAIQNFKDTSSEEFEKFYEEFSILDKEEILKGVFRYISRDMKKYNGKSELEVRKSRVKRESSSTGRRERRDGSTRGSNSSGVAQRGFDRYFLAMGRNDGMQPGSVIRMIAKTIDVEGSVVGKIDVKESFSFFEVPTNLKDKVLSMDKKHWGNRTINVELAKQPTKSPRSFKS